MFGTPVEFFTEVLPSLARRHLKPPIKNRIHLLLIVLLPGILVIFDSMMDPYWPGYKEFLRMYDLIVVPSFLFLVLAAIITAIVAIVKGWVRGWVRIIIVLALIVYVPFFLAYLLIFLLFASDPNNVL